MLGIRNKLIEEKEQLEATFNEDQQLKRELDDLLKSMTAEIKKVQEMVDQADMI